MGGWGSGRPESTAKLDAGLKLEISRLIKEDVISSEGGWRAGSWRWRYYGGDSTSVCYESNTNDPHNMWLRLHYTHNSYYDDPQKMDYKIRLVTTRPNYGGKRLWFECPITYRRAAVLYSPPGSKWFASRHAFRRCKYRSQGRSAKDRAIDKMWRLKSKLEDDGDYYLKPKGMHWKTFDRMLGDVERAEEVCDYYLANHLAVLFERFGFPKR